ncbi:MAG: protease HtpX [Gemmatimonadota bacterium]|nr:protease HtpX [Gemmatimonadota bacterium]MDH5197701.1 protease HtpX [Gemmatimonadota bacterium]
MLRILLFLATNVAVLMMAAVAMTVLTALGIIPPDAPYIQLLVWCALFGFGGAVFSLAISKWMAKRATRAHVIDTPQNDIERWLVGTIERQAKQAGIGMPEVAVFESPDPNAFATGMFRNSALVAVSTGLLRLMTKEEVEAVLGHEISHIANGDMVTLTLIQGVLNTFVLFVARLIASQFERGRFLIYLALQMAFGVLASMIVAWFSRRREFRADAGGARLESASAMAAALERLRAAQDAPSQLPASLTAFGIRGKGVAVLLSTHPPLEERIARLRGG